MTRKPIRAVKKTVIAISTKKTTSTRPARVEARSGKRGKVPHGYRDRRSWRKFGVVALVARAIRRSRRTITNMIRPQGQGGGNPEDADRVHDRRTCTCPSPGRSRSSTSPACRSASRSCSATPRSGRTSARGPGTRRRRSSGRSGRRGSAGRTRRRGRTGRSSGCTRTGTRSPWPAAGDRLLVADQGVPARLGPGRLYRFR